MTTPAETHEYEAALRALTLDNEKRGVRSAHYYRARRVLGIKIGESVWDSLVDHHEAEVAGLRAELARRDAVVEAARETLARVEDNPQARYVMTPLKRAVAALDAREEAVNSGT